MSFEIGQTVWLLSAEVDEYGSPKFPCIYPQSLEVHEAKISSLEDEDGLIEIQFIEPGGHKSSTLVEPRLLLSYKPQFEKTNPFLLKV